MFATRWLAPLVLVSVVGVSAAAAPAEGEKGFAALRDSPFGRLISYNVGRLISLKAEANVTPEQRDKVRAAIKGHKPEIGEVVKDLVAKKRALRDAVRKDTPNEEAIRKAADDLGHSIGNAAVLASKVRGELKPNFTDKQIEVFQKFVNDHDASVDRWLQEAFTQ